MLGQNLQGLGTQSSSCQAEGTLQSQVLEISSISGKSFDPKVCLLLPRSIYPWLNQGNFKRPSYFLISLWDQQKVIKTVFLFTFSHCPVMLSSLLYWFCERLSAPTSNNENSHLRIYFPEKFANYGLNCVPLKIMFKVQSQYFKYDSIWR